MSESFIKYDHCIFDFNTLKSADDEGNVKEYPEILECVIGDEATYRALKTRDVEDGTVLFVLYESDFHDKDGKACGWSEICGRHLTMASVNSHVELLERMKADKAKAAEIERTSWDK